MTETEHLDQLDYVFRHYEEPDMEPGDYCCDLAEYSRGLEHNMWCRA